MFSIYGLLIEKLKCVGSRGTERSVVRGRRKGRAPWPSGQIPLLAVYTQTSAHPDGTSGGPLSGPKRKN